MLNKTNIKQKTYETVASGWLIYLNCMMMHGPANVKCALRIQMKCYTHYLLCL